jgi:hypothetical protein
VLAAAARLSLDAGERQDARHERLDPLAAELGVVGRGPLRRIEAVEHCQRPAHAAARRVDRHLRRLVQPADAVARLAARREAVGPLLCRAIGELLERHALPLRGLGLQPRQEVGRREVWEREQDVGKIPLGVDDERGDPVERGLLDEPDQEARLAAARHAHADGVGREPLRLDQHRLAGGGALGVVHFLAEVEDAEPLDRGGQVGGRGLLGPRAFRGRAHRFGLRVKNHKKHTS